MKQGENYWKRRNKERSNFTSGWGHKENESHRRTLEFFVEILQDIQDVSCPQHVEELRQQPVEGRYNNTNRGNKLVMAFLVGWHCKFVKFTLYEAIYSAISMLIYHYAIHKYLCYFFGCKWIPQTFPFPWSWSVEADGFLYSVLIFCSVKLWLNIVSIS